MSGVARKYASVWRRSGLNYIQAMTAASNALRHVLKEPKRSQALARASLVYRTQKWEEGKPTVERTLHAGCAVCLGVRCSARLLWWLGGIWAPHVCHRMWPCLCVGLSPRLRLGAVVPRCSYNDVPHRSCSQLLGAAQTPSASSDVCFRCIC